MAGDVWQQQVLENRAAHEGDLKNMEGELQAREAKLAEMDREKEEILANLQKAAAHCEHHQVDLVRIRGDNSQFLASKEELAKEVQDLKSSLAEMRSQRRRELDDSREKGYEAGRTVGLEERIRWGRQEAMQELFYDGIAHCRSHILMSPPGQKFLDTLVQSLPEAYLHSHAFRQELLPSLSNMIATMLFSIYDQLQAQDRIGEVDIDQVLPQILDCGPAVNPAHGVNSPWYLDSLKSAAAVFQGRRTVNAPAIAYPLLGQIDYPVHAEDTAACRTLQMAFDARAVRYLQQEVDRALTLCGLDPEDVLKTAEVVDTETGEAIGEEVGMESPGAARVIEGAGIVRVEQNVIQPLPAPGPEGEDQAEGHVEDIAEEEELNI